MPERDPLSGPDNAWRRMGQIDNLMTITGILWFDEQVGYEQLCERLEERLLYFDRFSQRIGGRKRRFRRPYWETVEDFDIETHVYDISLPEPADDEAFQRFVGRLMSRPLDERRPLWEAYLIEDVDKGDGNAVAVRLNHSIADGFALLYVLLGLADDPHAIDLPIGELPLPPNFQRPSSGEDAGPAVNQERVSGQSTTATETATARETRPGSRSDSGSSPDESPSLTDGPFGAVGAAAGLASGAYGLLTMGNEPDVSLRNDLGTRKRAGWTDRIDLDRVKELKQQYDATVNDVLLGVTAGALRRELEERGEATDGVEIRCTVPVNLVPMRERGETLGNEFGLAFIPLPVGVEPLDERIQRIRDEATPRKVGIEAFLMYKLLQVGGYVPEIVQQQVMKFFEDRATGIVTNVPGPMETFELAGAEVTDMVFWVPQAIDQGLGISLFTYDNSVRIGIASDDNVLSDPSRLANHFAAEIEMLEAELERIEQAE